MDCEKREHLIEPKLVYALWERWVINNAGTFTPNVPTFGLESINILDKKKLLDYAIILAFTLIIWIIRNAILMWWNMITCLASFIVLLLLLTSLLLHGFSFFLSHTHINCILCFIVVFSVSTDDHQDACSWVIKIKSRAINIQHSRKPTITLESSYRTHLGNRRNNSAGRLWLTTASHLCRMGF